MRDRKTQNVSRRPPAIVRSRQPPAAIVCPIFCRETFSSRFIFFSAFQMRPTPLPLLLMLFRPTPSFHGRRLIHLFI